MILFVIRVFADVIKVKVSRWDYSKLRLVLNSITGVLVRDRKGKDTERCREGGHVKTKAETGLMCPHTRNSISDSHQKLRERPGRDLSPVLQKKLVLAPSLWASQLQNCE